MRALITKVLLPFGRPPELPLTPEGKGAGRAPRRRTCFCFFAVLSHHRTLQLIGSPPFAGASTHSSPPQRGEASQIARYRCSFTSRAVLPRASILPGNTFWPRARNATGREVPQWPCKMAYGQHQRGQLPRAALLFAGLRSKLRLTLAGPVRRQWIYELSPASRRRMELDSRSPSGGRRTVASGDRFSGADLERRREREANEKLCRAPRRNRGTRLRPNARRLSTHPCPGRGIGSRGRDSAESPPRPGAGSPRGSRARPRAARWLAAG